LKDVVEDACLIVADGVRPVLVVTHSTSPPNIVLRAPLNVVQIACEGPLAVGRLCRSMRSGALCDVHSAYLKAVAEGSRMMYHSTIDDVDTALGFMQVDPRYRSTQLLLFSRGSPEPVILNIATNEYVF